MPYNWNEIAETVSLSPPTPTDLSWQLRWVGADTAPVGAVDLSMAPLIPPENTAVDEARAALWQMRRRTAGSTQPPTPIPEDDPPPTEDSRAYIPRAVRNDWRTPDIVLAVVRRALGGTIDLDPCASTEHWLQGGDEIGDALNFHEEDDGLALTWFDSLRANGCEAKTAYVNPPFNRNRDWVAKCRAEAALGVEIVMLIPARTDTRYWQNDIAQSADAIAFWRGRIRFVGATAGAPFPCALVYWGPNAERFRSVLRAAGHHVVRNVTDSGVESAVSYDPEVPF